MSAPPRPSAAPGREALAAALAAATPLLDAEAARSGAAGTPAVLAAWRDVADALDAALAALEAEHRDGGEPDWDAAREVSALARRLVDDGLATTLRTIERADAAAERLAEAGAASEIIEQAPERAAEALDLDRVLLSRVQGGRLIAQALSWRGDRPAAVTALERLRESPTPLDYPLIEGEMVRRRRPLLIADAAGEAGGRAANAQIMGWRDYVAAPIVLEGRAIGFLHGDRLPSGRRVGPLDRDALWRFALAFAHLYERVVLRRRLRIQRREMRQIASWADARTGELSDGAIDLASAHETPERDDPSPAPPASDSQLRDLLTRREIDVLQLMVRGETNAGIARELVVSEGTVKFHVKNILRKLHASNRAEATSRYLRLTLHRNERGAGPGAARR